MISYLELAASSFTQAQFLSVFFVEKPPIDCLFDGVFAQAIRYLLTRGMLLVYDIKII